MATEACVEKSVRTSRKGNPMLAESPNSWLWVTCPSPDHPDHPDTYVALRGCTSLRVREWWVTFNEGAKGELNSVLSGEVVTRSCVIQPAVERTRSCAHCGPKAWKELVDYSQLLAKEIDRAVAAVSEVLHMFLTSLTFTSIVCRSSSSSPSDECRFSAKRCRNRFLTHKTVVIFHENTFMSSPYVTPAAACAAAKQERPRT